MKRILLITLFTCQILSCGKITSFQFKIDNLNEESYYHLTTKVNQSNYRLPVFSLPLYDFSVGLIVGEITVSGDNTIDLKLNTNVIDGIDMNIDWKLPNGKPIPYVLKPDTKTYHFQIGNSKSRVYLAFDKEQAILGLSLNISELSPTQVAGGLNTFIPFDREKITGTMGLYLGNQLGTSGFALFIDFSSIVGSKASKRETYVENPSRKSFLRSAKIAKKIRFRNDLQLH